jgi:hypothetical protein
MAVKNILPRVYRNDLDIQNTLVLDGVDDRVTLPNLGISGNAAITVEAWVNVNATSGVYSIFGFGAGDTTQSFVMRLENGNSVKFHIGTGTADEVFVTTANYYYSWVHIAAVYDPSVSTMYLYSNGILVGSKTATNPNFSNSNYWIGMFPTGFYYMKGRISELRIWNSVRTAQQLLDNKNKKLLGTESDLKAYYRFNEGTGTTINDTTSNAFHGALQNAAPTWDTNTLPPIFNRTYKGIYPDYAVSSFSSSINAGSGELKIKVPRKFDNFGEGSEIDFNNEIEYYVYDKDAPNGIKIYTGTIQEYSSSVTDKEEVEVRVIGSVFNLDNDILKSGNTIKLGISGIDPGNEFKYIVNKYRENNPYSRLNYTSTSIQLMGATRNYAFSSETYLSAIEQIMKTVNADWYWYIDSSDIFYFQQIATIPKHFFTFGKNITSIKQTKSILDMTNSVLFWNDNSPSISKLYTDSLSASKYGRRVKKIKDSRFTNTTSADNYAQREIDVAKNPLNTIEIEIIDNNYSSFGYDIESIKPGDTFRILNVAAGSPLYSLNVITSITYNINSVKIVASDRQAFVARRLYELQRQADEMTYARNGPTNYTN